MTKGATRAATAAKLKEKKDRLPTRIQPKRLQFSPQPNPEEQTPPQKSKAKAQKTKKKISTPIATTSTAATATAGSKTTTTVSETLPPSNTPTTETFDTEDTMAARIPFPPFRTDDIEAWFRRAEHWFTFSKVTTEADKFALIASQIEHPTVVNLDEMLNQHEETPYTTIKTKIISIFEKTTSAKINDLLSGCQLGDRRPSQLLAEMKRLGGTTGEDILRSLWSKRLPIHIQTIVAAATKSNLEEVALIADAVIDVVGTPTTAINQVNSGKIQQLPQEENQPTEKSEIQSLCAAVNHLTKSFREMQSDRSRSKSRDNRKNRDSSSSNKLKEDRICRYHRKFGAKAYLCTQPCSFVPDDETKN